MKFPITNNVEAAMTIAQCGGWMAVCVDYSIVFPAEMQRAPIIEKDIVLKTQRCYDALIDDIASGMVVLDDIRRIDRDHDYETERKYSTTAGVFKRLLTRR